jgi:hypothetical protein
MKYSHSRLWALLAALSIGAWSSVAAANDPATATMLFNDAKRLASAGSYVDACPKFEESQRLDPAIGTQYNLADCYEHTGKTASAWAMFLDVASAATASGQPARAQVASQRAAALESKVSKLTIAAPKTATGLEVRRNGELLGSVLWGNAAPVDPGSYTIEASAPGKRRWSSVATVGPNGAHVTVTIPPLEAAGAPAAAASAPFPPATAAASPASPAVAEGPTAVVDEKPRGDGQRVAGMIVGGAGVVGLGVGAAFGILSLAKHSDFTSHCAGNQCDAQGISSHNDAVTDGNVATGTFIGSGILLAAGVALWLSAPKSHSTAAWQVAPTIGAGHAGLSLKGSWL